MMSSLAAPMDERMCPVEDMDCVLQSSTATLDDRNELLHCIEEKNTEIVHLRARLEKYEAIFQGLSDGILLIDEKFSDCNKEACRIWSCDQEDIIGFFPSDFAPLLQPGGEDSFTLSQKRIAEALQGKLQKFEWKDIRRDGMAIDTEVILNRITVSGKRYVLATFRDITDRKIQENERQALLHMMEAAIEDRTRSLQEYNASLNEEISQRLRVEHSLERAYLELEQIFDTSGDGILVLDTDRNIIRANLAFADLVEKKISQILGAKCYSIFPCHKRCTDHCILQEIVTGSSRTDFEKEFLSESGERKSCLVKAAALRSASGELLGIVKTYKDLTGYKRWVDMLQESEEFHRLTLASISDAIFLTTDTGEFIFISCNAPRIFGYDVEEIPKQFPTLFDLAGCCFYVPEELQTLGEISNIEVTIRDKYQKAHVLIANIKKTQIRSGTTLVAFRDITDRKIEEKRAKVEYEQLVQAGKMVSLGILVSGVAHEINNPNNSIILNTPLMIGMWADARNILDEYMRENGDFMLGKMRYSYARERVPELFSGIMASSRRIKNIVQDLKNYARQGSSVLNEVIDINGALHTSVVLLDNQLRKATDHFHIAYGLGIPHFLGNFQKIEQVIINVLQNACEALDDKSKAIHVATGHDPQTRTVWLKITDQGRGIRDSDLPHLTDPFFTTRRACGGTGLGLSISSRIMQEHHGSIVFESEYGQGAAVTLIFPEPRTDEP